MAAIDRAKGLLHELGSEAVAKLSFSDRCAIYLLVKLRKKHSLIAEAFGCSRNTVSRIAHAERDKTYRDVRDEFHKLGEDEFAFKYFTDEIETRFRRFKYDRAAPSEDRRPPNFHIGADSHAGPFSIQTYDGKRTVVCEIYLASDGWTYRQTEEPGAYESKYRFRTSKLAKRHAIETGYARDPEQFGL